MDVRMTFKSLIIVETSKNVIQKSRPDEQEENNKQNFSK